MQPLRLVEPKGTDMHATTSPAVQAVAATRREWIGLAVLALPTLLVSLDVSVLYLALPSMSRDLNASSTQQLWILDIYSFMLAGFLVTMGTLGDRIGRRRLLLAGAGAFGVASVVAAYASSPEMLIASRALLGIAGATLMPSTMALIRNMFRDPKEMGAAIGIWFSCFMGGMTIGPLVGGVLLAHFWWGSAFLLGVPFMILLLILGPVLLPEHRAPDAGRIDVLSVALSLGAILPVIYGLKEIARNGVSELPVVAIVAGLGLGLVFVQRQRTLADPLLDLRLFSNRLFSTALGMWMLVGMVMSGIGLMTAIYLQTVLGYSPLHAGLLVIPQNVVMAAGSMVSPIIARRLRQSVVTVLGLAISASGFAVLTSFGGSHATLMLVLGLVLATGGIALPMPLMMGMMLGVAPPEKAGAAASLSETSGEFGIALGIAILGSIGTGVYRTRLHDSLPAGLPATAGHAARESMVGAAGAAHRVGGPLGDALFGAARAAFTSGLHSVAAVGGVLMLALAVGTAAAARRFDTAMPGAPQAPAAEAETADTSELVELTAA